MCVGVSVCLLGVFVSQLALTSELHVDRHHLSRSMCMENISVAMRLFDIIIVHFNPNANTCACGLAVFFPMFRYQKYSEALVSNASSAAQTLTHLQPR